MSTALYRRYRPETFADVIGQEHVTEPLLQALRTGRTSHAYLFSGPRGCGKTTSARILARCLNCEQGPTPTPCGECDSCVALSRGGAGSVDVIEIDAASHGGVEDARELRERASYGPAQSRYKVYIIDEAHMVTPQGFNALLKIVEEPPEHVKFVFATTEPDKVIGTIRSRTHHYPFRLVPPARLQGYLEQVCEREGVAVQPGVLSFVVRAGGGSVRDSLSVLDQLIAGSGEEGLTYERAAALLGFTDGELLDATIDAFGAGDAAGVFHQIDRVIETGLDPRRFVEDLLERFRDLIVVSATPEGAASILRGLPEDQIDRMRQQAATFGAGSLSRAADVINAGLTDMTGATAPRLQLELIAARVLLPGAAGEAGYAARLDRLERRLEVGGVPSAPRSGQPSTQSSQPSSQLSQPSRRPSPQPPTPAPRAAEVATGPTASDVQTPDAQTPDAPEPATAPGPGLATASQPPQETEPPEKTEPATASEPPGKAEPTAPARAAASPAPSAAPGPAGLDLAAVRRAWPDVLARIFALKRTSWTLLSEHAQVVDYDGRRFVLGLSTTGLANAFRGGVHAEVVRQALVDALGIDVRVEGIVAAEAPRPHDEAEHAPTGAPPDPPAPSTGVAPEEGAATPSRPAGPGEDWASTPTDPSTAPSWASEQPDRAPEGGGGGDSPDSAVSDDDEDIAEAGEVGAGVVERILGGRVIGEDG